MATIAIFAISGLAIALLIFVKALSLKFKRGFILLDAIARGDSYARDLYHRATHLYLEGKDTGHFYWNKQIPMKAKSLMNKGVTYLKEQREQYLHNMRNSRLLKKDEGISEFFKNMSSVEKGNGSIHEYYEDDFQNGENDVK